VTFANGVDVRASFAVPNAGEIIAGTTNAAKMTAKEKA